MSHMRRQSLKSYSCKYCNLVNDLYENESIVLYTSITNKSLRAVA